MTMNENEPVARCAWSKEFNGPILCNEGDEDSFDGRLYRHPAPAVAHPPAEVVRELKDQLQRMVDFVTTGLEVKEDHPYVEMACAALKSAKEHGL